MQCQKILNNFRVIGQFFDSITTPVTEQIGITDIHLKKHQLIHKDMELSWISSYIIPLYIDNIEMCDETEYLKL